MIIAVDFDGTIVEHRYPEIGKPIPNALNTLKQLQNEGHRLILWTIRDGGYLDEAVEYCRKQGLVFYAHNANFPEEDPSFAPRKLKADMFIDDRSFGGLQDWNLIYRAIRDGRGLAISFVEGEGNYEPSIPKKRFKLF